MSIKAAGSPGAFVTLAAAGVLGVVGIAATRSGPALERMSSKVCIPLVMAPPPVVDRCRELPQLPEVRPCDCSEPYNSDGSPKRLPPAPLREPGQLATLFRLDDFGPPSMRPGELGDAWWSWEGGGSWQMCDEFDIRVVVYHGTARDRVAARYPTIKNQSDYRLIERDAALQYLDEQIAYLASKPRELGDYDFGPLRRDLEKTRHTILRCFEEVHGG